MVQDVVTAAIFVRLHVRSPDSNFAWEVFKLAARLDDFGLAVAAVKKLDRPDKLLINGPKADFEEIQPKYVYALLRSAVTFIDTQAVDGPACVTGYRVGRAPAETAKNFTLR